MKFTSKILSNDIHSNQYHLLVVERPKIFSAEPGQFALVSIEGFKLRRPLSFFNISDDEITFFYKPAGHGLKNLSKLGPGNFVNFYGPYGKPLPDNDASLFSDFNLHPALHFLAKKKNREIQPLNKIDLQENIIIASDLRHLLKDKNIPDQAYLFCQETMGCGVGACMSCVIHTSKGETKKICQEGPFIKKEDLI